MVGLQQQHTHTHTKNVVEQANITKFIFTAFQLSTLVINHTLRTVYYSNDIKQLSAGL